MNSIRTQPVPWLAICSIRPLRTASSWVTAPRYSSGASMVSRSNGSWTLPPTVLVTTCGLPTVSSKPSRRIVSTRMASASSPRPCTSQVSGRSVGSTRIDTLPTSSRSSRSLTSRAVIFVPLARPAIGEVFAPIVIEIAGSSTVMSGSGRGSSGSARVSPMVISGMPATAMMSPGPGRLRRHALERLGHQQLGDLDAMHRAVAAAPGDLLTLADRPVVDPAQREPAEERRRVEVGDVRLQRHLGVVRRCRHRLEDGPEERLEVRAVRHGRRRRGASRLARPAFADA